MVKVAILFKGKRKQIILLSFLREKFMKLKVLSTLAVSVVASASLVAQTSTIVESPAGTGKPASSITMSPSIESGMRAFTTNGTEKNKTSSTIGAYVTPSFELGAKFQNFDLAVNYSLELTSARGFGAGNEEKRIIKNSSMTHNPVLIATMRLSPDWTFVNTSDLGVTTGNLEEDDTLAAVNLAEIYRKINSNLSVAVGYRVDLSDNPDSIVKADKNNSFAAQLEAGNTKGVPAAVLAANKNVGNNPYSVRNVGVVRAKIKANEKLSTNISGESGMITSNKGPSESSTYVYRVNADTTITPIKDFSLAIRTRAEFTNPKGAQSGFSSVYLGRLIAGYQFNESVAANLTNTFLVKNKINFSDTSVYENETYAGLSYSF